jgi:hypothetical protein
LRMRNWMPASSVASAIAPPSASTSLTRWPLPMPPMDGLQLIWPRVSMLCVSSRVSRAHAGRRQRRLGAGLRTRLRRSRRTRLDGCAKLRARWVSRPDVEGLRIIGD